jgi:pimeloyl-ACP methyl ester carboxylesterase
VRSLQTAVRDLLDADLQPVPGAGRLAPEEQPETIAAAVARLAARGPATGCAG